ncbi:MAG: T9SS type A sorting domain-containing protein, partial [Bacteroidota bacterium]
PGFSPGRMTFASNQRFLNGAVLKMDVEGTGDEEADQIQVNGVVNLNNLNLEVNVNYSPTNGDVIEIIRASVIAGNFASVNLPPGWTVSLGASVMITFNSGLLPVELTHFEAVKAGKTVALNWTTATEIDNEGFEVLRAVDGTNWQSIGFVPGRGHTDERATYTFTDPAPVEGENYYRLRQYDFDGQFTDSPMRVIHFGQQQEALSLAAYPNPTQQYVTIRWASVINEGMLSVVDIQGRVVQQISLSHQQQQQSLDLSDLPAGQYVVRLRHNHDIYTRLLHKNY